VSGWAAVHAPAGAPSGRRSACYTPPSTQSGNALPTYARRRPRPGAAPGSDPVTVLDEIVADQIRTDLPEISPGDTVRVSVKVREGNRERVQVFEGTVMRMRGGGITRSITVRALRSGVGVERTFPVHSPKIVSLEVVSRGKVRRSKLYYLRDKVGKSARVKELRNV